MKINHHFIKKDVYESGETYLFRSIDDLKLARHDEKRFRQMYEKLRTFYFKDNSINLKSKVTSVCKNTIISTDFQAVIALKFVKERLMISLQKLQI